MLPATVSDRGRHVQQLPRWLGLLGFRSWRGYRFGTGSSLPRSLSANWTKRYFIAGGKMRELVFNRRQSWYKSGWYILDTRIQETSNKRKCILIQSQNRFVFNPGINLLTSCRGHTFFCRSSCIGNSLRLGPLKGFFELVQRPSRWPRLASYIAFRAKEKQGHRKVCLGGLIVCLL